LKEKISGEKFVLDKFGKEEMNVLESVLGEIINELKV
jgi:hypothetical protein